MNEQEFPQGSVPVAVAARVYGKDASWVRAGIVSGWLPIGKATRGGKLVTTIEEMDSRYGDTEAARRVRPEERPRTRRSGSVGAA